MEPECKVRKKDFLSLPVKVCYSELESLDSEKDNARIIKHQDNTGQSLDSSPEHDKTEYADCVFEIKKSDNKQLLQNVTLHLGGIQQTKDLKEDTVKSLLDLDNKDYVHLPQG